MKQRLKRVIGILLIIISALIAYALFCYLTKTGIPCIFNLITGLKCPGCGITRMFLSILKLEFPKAFSFNPVIFVMLPVFFIIFVRVIYVYLKEGHLDPGKRFNHIIYIIIAILIIFGILRNIF